MKETKKNRPMTVGEVCRYVLKRVRKKRTCDLHTHIAGLEHALCLLGAEETLRYHYSVCDYLRTDRGRRKGREWFLAQTPRKQAKEIWKACIRDQPLPMTTTCFGVNYLLGQFDLDPRRDNFSHWEQFIEELTPAKYTDAIFDMAGLDWVTMTNDIGDEKERQFWLDDGAHRLDPRFKPVLRCDAILDDSEASLKVLQDLGYEVKRTLDAKCIGEYRRFVYEWVSQMGALYVAISLPPTWRFDNDRDRMAKVLKKAVMPECSEIGIPVALMIGVNRGVNPIIGAAGDSVGANTDVRSIEKAAKAFPDLKLFVTLLHSADQYPLAVAARKFANIIPFGCWWWLNTPQEIESITERRIDLLGDTFIWQHSDARITDQLAYKWYVNRIALAKVLTAKIEAMINAGILVTRKTIDDQIDLYLNRTEQYLAV